MEPFNGDGLTLCWGPAPVVHLPVIFELALQLLPVELEFIEQVRLVVLLPDPDLLAYIAQ